MSEKIQNISFIVKVNIIEYLFGRRDIATGERKLGFVDITNYNLKAILIYFVTFNDINIESAINKMLINKVINSWNETVNEFKNLREKVGSFVYYPENFYRFLAFKSNIEIFDYVVKRVLINRININPTINVESEEVLEKLVSFRTSSETFEDIYVPIFRDLFGINSNLSNFLLYYISMFTNEIINYCNDLKNFIAKEYILQKIDETGKNV